MILSLFSRREPPAIRGVHLYFSSDAIIVAPLHQDQHGISYEQPTPHVLAAPATPGELGSAFRKAFDAFSLQDKDMRDAKRSDWPAYRASGTRTLKEFEARFRTMLCYGLNASNAVVRASMAHPSSEDIELSVTFNPLLAPETIGEKLLHLTRTGSPS